MRPPDTHINPKAEHPMSETNASLPAPRKTKTTRTRKIAPQNLPGTAFESTQLSLFQNFLANTPTERERLSNTIALWDSVPRYSITRNLQSKLRTPHGTLDLLKLNFHHQGEDYLTTITPARIEIKDGPDKGKTLDYYPSSSEELIEDVLRKMAADQQQGFFDKKGYVSGVAFSLYQLQEELSKLGHSRSYAEIALSLEILHKTNIQITTSNGRDEQIRSSTYFPALGAVRRKDIEADPTARWVVQFHPLVTRSIDEVTYRQFNYHQLMSHRLQQTAGHEVHVRRNREHVQDEVLDHLPGQCSPRRLQGNPTGRGSGDHRPRGTGQIRSSSQL
jgi:hypothetical protein